MRVISQQHVDWTVMLGDDNLVLFHCSTANAPDSDRRDLLSELELMKTLKPHPHVIKLMGCVTESGNGKNIQVISHG